METGSSRVLVVDDEPQITRVLRTVLSSHGYQVRTAAEGESALSNFKEWSPELVITDLYMPHMDGVELCRRIREVSAVPIIVAASVAAGAAALPSVAATTTKTVAVKDNFFGPKKLTITKGSKVKWVWKGKQAHNVFATKGSKADFHFGTRKTGTKSHTFTKRGTYSIFCTIHAPDMHMTIKVK